MIVVFDAKDETYILKKYNNLIYNWKTNPIKSIELNFEKSYELGRAKTNKNDYRFYLWRNNYFKVEKLKNINYLNIYFKENGKLCGKDSFGNNLYFPKDVECPINDLFIESSKRDLEGYERINLDNEYYLYYSNNNTNGTIIIDFKAGPYFSYQIDKDTIEDQSNPLELNLDKSKQICSDIERYIEGECKDFFHFYTTPFYKQIDNWDYISFISNTIKNTNLNSLDNDVIFLYKIFYKGIKSTKVSNKKLIKNIDKNMKIFKIFYVFKIIFFCIIAIIHLAFCMCYKEIKKNKTFSIINFLIIIIYFIFSIIHIKIYIKYINNFIDMIDIYFEKSKISFIREVITILYLFIIFLNFSIFIFFSQLCDIKCNEYCNFWSICEKCKKKRYFGGKKDNSNISEMKELKHKPININENKNIENENQNDNVNNIKENDINQDNNIKSKNNFNKNNINDNNKININDKDNENKNDINNNIKNINNININKNDDINKKGIDNKIINNEYDKSNEIDNSIKEEEVKSDKPIEMDKKINQEDIKKNINNNIIINNDNDIDKNSSNNFNIIKIEKSQVNSSSSERSILKGKPLCIICEINPTKIIIVPCGHRCMCQKCYEKEKKRIEKCPMCNGKIESILDNVYDI